MARALPLHPVIDQLLKVDLREAAARHGDEHADEGHRGVLRQIHTAHQHDDRQTGRHGARDGKRYDILGKKVQ